MKHVSIGINEIADTLEVLDSQLEEEQIGTELSVVVRGGLQYQSSEGGCAIKVGNSRSSVNQIDEGSQEQ